MSEGQPFPAKGAAVEPLHPRAPTPIPPEPDRKPRSDLPARLVTAGILVPFVIYMIYLGGLWYLGTVIAIILLGQREFYRLIEDKGAQPLVSWGLAAGAALPVVAYLGNEYHATILMTFALLGVMVAQLRKPQITEALSSISGTFFGVFYVGWLLSHAVVLRGFYDKVGVARSEELGLVPEVGIFFMIFALAALVGCDTGAYFAGRAYGKRKLAPRISPGKSVEGAIGGILAGTAAGLLMKGVFDVFWPSLSQAFTWSAAIPFGIVLSLVGILGDLVESLLKRDAKVKDTGALLPGTGGVLDRIDSPLLGIPVMYYMLLGYVFLRVG